MSVTPSTFSTWTNRAILLLGTIILGISTLLIVGWVFEIPLLMSFGYLTSIIPLTSAVSFFFAGVLLIGAFFSLSPYWLILCLPIFLLTTINLIEGVCNVNMHVNEFFRIPHEVTIDTITVSTILSFYISLVSFFFIFTFKNWTYRPLFIGISGAIIIGIAMIPYVGYLSGFDSSYGWWPDESVMDFMTTNLFLLLGLALFATSWSAHDEQGENRYPLWFSASVSFCFLMATICLWQALETQEVIYGREEATREAQHIKTDITYTLKDEVLSFERMANRWKSVGGTPHYEWVQDASFHIKHDEGVVEIIRMDPSGDDYWFISRDRNTPTEEDLLYFKTLLTKSSQKQSVFLTALDKFDGWAETLFIIVPLNVNNQFDGSIIAVLDLNHFLHNIVNESVQEKYDVIIRDSQNDLLYSSIKEIKGPRLGKAKVSFNILDWHICVADTNRSQFNSLLPIFTLLEGILISLLVFLALYFAGTSRAQTEKVEKTYNQLAETQNRMVVQDKLAALGTLTAGISHELKNPLNFITNFSDLSMGLIDDIQKVIEPKKSLFSESELDTLNFSTSSILENLKIIFTQGKRANNIIHLMLAHSRNHPGTAKPSARMLVDLAGLLTEYVKLSHYGIKSQYPDFNVQVEEYYDPAVGKMEVYAEDLTNAILNLLNNALYALKEKKQKLGEDFVPKLKISLKKINNYCEIRIRDNGMGIPSDIANKIFVPFFTTKPPGEGTGLGLSQTHQIIVEKHNGSLHFDTQEGKYTEFILMIPIKYSGEST